MRASSLWGREILATCDYRVGDSVAFDEPRLLLPRPEGVGADERPLEAHPEGWVIRPRGATEGHACLGALERPLADLAGQRIARVGDRGRLEYGGVALTFEVVRVPARLPRTPVDPGLVAAGAFALVVVGGGLALVWSVTGHRPPGPPPALLDPRRIARVYLGADAGAAPSALAAPPAHRPVDSAHRAGALGEGPPSARDPEHAVQRALAPAEVAALPIPPRDVYRALLAHDPEAERCFVDQASAADGDGSWVTLRWIVKPNGAAESVTVVGATAGMSAVERCLTRHVRGLEFGARDAPAPVVYTYQTGPR